MQKKATINGIIDEYGAPPPDSACCLCGSKGTLIVFGVAPPEGELMGSNVIICGKCIKTAINQFSQSQPRGKKNE